MKTTPYTPEQNGSAEREMRTVVESARSMLYTKNLLKYLWAEAVNTAIYVLNRTTRVKDPNTTYEIWTSKKPKINSHLRTFGNIVYMHVSKQFRTKLDAKSKKLIHWL